jgi:hypothetical protein
MPDDIILVLRSPSGLEWDSVKLDRSVEGWISRDADGFGVWRESEGSAGGPNGGSLPLDLRSLLISLALSSLKEAWSEAYSIYGLCFDLVGCFLQRALELFMERFLTMVEELVIDVSMFLSIEVEDASGTAGIGIELSFRADGEILSEFLRWLYDNIFTFIDNIVNPSGAGDYRGLPMDIVARCSIGLLIKTDIEMPIQISKMAPKGTELPDSILLGASYSVNLAIPMKLLGYNVEGGEISYGVMIVDAPDSLVSLFYDIGGIGLTQDLYLIRARLWEDKRG